VIVTPLTATILLSVFNGQFPESSFISFSQIQTQTDIPESDLKKGLGSLCLGKYKILLRPAVESTGRKEISTDDTFRLDVDFKCPLARIKLLVSSTSSVSKPSGENEVERDETMAKIEELRRHQIEAAIVRVMKMRKTLGYNELVEQVIGLLKGRFAPTVLGIKGRIEGLIEREYLERDEGDLSVFRYLA
jgi:cullin 3